MDEAALEGAKEGAELIRDGIDLQRPIWPPLAQSTIDRKGHDQIMYDTGDFFRSIQADPAGKGEATYSTDLEYMPIHEFGLLAPLVPARPSFIPTVQGSELQQIINAAINVFDDAFM